MGFCIFSHPNKKTENKINFRQMTFKRARIEPNQSEYQLKTTTMRDLYTREQINRVFDRAGYGGSKRAYTCCFCVQWLLSHGRPRHLQSESHQDRQYMYYLKTRAYLDTVVPRDISSTVVSFLTGQNSIKRAIKR